jgi:hypothetical protein
MSVVDQDLPLPRALAWRRDNTSPLLANFMGEYSAWQTCERSKKVKSGFCRDGNVGALSAGHRHFSCLQLDSCRESRRRIVLLKKRKGAWGILIVLGAMALRSA